MCESRKVIMPLNSWKEVSTPHPGIVVFTKQQSCSHSRVSGTAGCSESWKTTLRSKLWNWRGRKRKRITTEAMETGRQTEHQGTFWLAFSKGKWDEQMMMTQYQVTQPSENNRAIIGTWVWKDSLNFCSVACTLESHPEQIFSASKGGILEKNKPWYF